MDFFGFRTGTLDVTISLQPPSGGGTLLTDTVELTSSAQGNELNTSREYNLTSLLPPNDDGRYHVRIDAKRTDSNGNGAKTKVIWLECFDAGSAPDVPPITGGDDDDDDENVGPIDGEAPGDVAAGGIDGDVAGTFVSNGEFGANAASDAQVSAVAADFADEGLALTGGGWRSILLIGLMTVAIGLGLYSFARARASA